jgi:hypothetical protein
MCCRLGSDDLTEEDSELVDSPLLNLNFNPSVFSSSLLGTGHEPWTGI